MENLGITTFNPGPGGSPVPLIAGDVVGDDSDPLSDGCCCSLCGGAAMTSSGEPSASRADAELQTEPPLFLHRLGAEDAAPYLRAVRDGLVRAADLDRPSDAVYRVVGTLKIPAKEPGQPLRLTGVFLRREHVQAGPGLTAGRPRLDADPLNPGLEQQ